MPWGRTNTYRRRFAAVASRAEVTSSPESPWSFNEIGYISSTGMKTGYDILRRYETGWDWPQF